jgi:hypothetical protein
MKYYYANAANQPAGPVSLDELRQLVIRGEITPLTHVIPVGETVWRPLSTLLETTGGAVSATSGSNPSPSSTAASLKPPSSVSASPTTSSAAVAINRAPTLLTGFIGGLIAKARALLSVPFLETLFRVANSLGQILVLAGAGLALIYGVVYAVKYNSFEIFLTGLASVLLLAVLQFVAKRLLEACASVVKNSPTRVASLAVIECLALLLLLGAVGALLHGIMTAIQLESVVPLVPALVFFVALAAAAGIALHPALAQVEQAPASAGEEAIGLFSFFAKASLVLQPLLFCVYAAAGVILILFAIFGQDGGFANSLLAFIPFEIPGAGGLVGASLLAAACLFPLFAYLAFLAYYLLIDVLRAILVLPSKLDQLRS